MHSIRIEIPEKLIPVFSGRADVRGAYGGRGSGKTRSFAKMAAIWGYKYGKGGVKGQILCARQFMNSLDDSSLEECKRAIEEEPFLLDYYEIGEKYIRSRDGMVWFTFSGLDRNISSVKSKGRILLCWVDEAEPVTDYAWKILEPTLREEGDDWNAELWVTWNPGRKNAAVEKRYRASKDPLVRVTQLNWRDNPKFPSRLERQRLRDMEERPESYDHIWEGAYGVMQGSILGRWVAQAEREGRITDSIHYDAASGPLEISCDLGFRDTASFWYWQRLSGGYNLLMYDGDNGLDANDWIPRIQKNIVKLGAESAKIWLPHDARAKTFQSKETVIEKFISAFGSGSCSVVPQSKKQDQISAARSIIQKCAFNRTECEMGLDGLMAWEFEYNEENGVFSREPIHNWASHPSDAFAYGCQVMQEHSPAGTERMKMPMRGEINVTTATLNDLWETAPKRSGRI